MKCNSKNVRAKKIEFAREKVQKEREEMLSAMSEEERETFLANERKQNQEACRRAKQTLTNMALISEYIRGPYSKF